MYKNSQEPQAAGQLHTTMKLRIAWLAIVVSTLFYGVIAYATERNYSLQPFSLALRRPIVIALYAIAAVVFAVAAAVTRRTPATPHAPLPDGGSTSLIHFVVGVALFETVAIIGLAAAIVDHDWRVYLPAWALALFGFLRTYPAGGDAR